MEIDPIYKPGEYAFFMYDGRAYKRKVRQVHIKMVIEENLINPYSTEQLFAFEWDPRDPGDVRQVLFKPEFLYPSLETFTEALFNATYESLLLNNHPKPLNHDNHKF